MNITKISGISIIILSLLIILSLSVIKSEMDKRDGELCEVYYSNPNMPMDQCPVHKDPSPSWIVMISFSIGIIMLIIGIYLTFKSNIKEKSKEERKVEISKLGDDERIIYNFLRDKEGSSYQSDLIKETGFSKVHMTRILDKMESKKIIERKRRGMTNIIVLR